MEVKVTTFRNPFSFFCLPANLTNVKDILTEKNDPDLFSNRVDFSGVSHGHYVAVLWKGLWARGIISKETYCQIWLIDFGFYLRLNDNTVFINLPLEEKRCPTKVFEASLHGVTPVDKVLTDIFAGEVEFKVGKMWSHGAIQEAQSLIHKAVETYFVPAALLDTKINDVVIGDLYLRIPNKGVVNLKDALQEPPVFLRKDPESYVQNLSIFYKNRRQHRASAMKPAIASKLPTITLNLTIDEYSDICAKAAELEVSECADTAGEGSTLTYLDAEEPAARDRFKLTPEEMEEYSQRYVVISGREYNMLNTLCNKARDLYMCDKYADQKYIGRATSRSSFRNNNLHY